MNTQDLPSDAPLCETPAPSTVVQAIDRLSSATLHGARRLFPLSRVRSVCSWDPALATAIHALELHGLGESGTFSTEKLGEGRNGAVYLLRAEHRTLVIKTFAAGDPLGFDGDAANALRREREALSTLSKYYPSVRLAPEATNEEEPFILAQYIDGCSLYAFIEEIALRPSLDLLPLSAELVRTVIEAMEESGRIHLDIKPGNFVLGLNEEGSFSGAKLIDWEMSIETPGDAEVVFPHCMGGTLLYAPPEQRGGAIQSRTPVFSMGCTLFGLWTGRAFQKLLKEHLGSVFWNAVTRDQAQLLGHAARFDHSVDSVLAQHFPDGTEREWMGDFLYRMLRHNACDRITLADAHTILQARALCHPYGDHDGDAVGEHIRRVLEGRANHAHPIPPPGTERYVLRGGVDWGAGEGTEVMQ